MSYRPISLKVIRRPEGRFIIKSVTARVTAMEALESRGPWSRERTFSVALGKRLMEKRRPECENMVRPPGFEPGSWAIFGL